MGERRYFLTTRPVISGMNTARFLISGISDEEAEEALLKGYESLNGTWDEPVVWLALAFCEWKRAGFQKG